MFQDFEDRSDPGRVAARLQNLRDELARHHLDGFVIPHADAFQGEYIPPGEERLYHVTGFSGSAGTAVLLGERAVLFVDGRYTLQAAQQTDTGKIEIRHLIKEPPAKWLEANARPGQRIGIDPWLHTVRGAQSLQKAADKAGAVLVRCNTNPVDAIWTDRPPPPRGKAIIHPLEYAGETAENKLAARVKDLDAAGVDATVLSTTDSIAWLFNIRGRDITHIPVILAYAILRADGRHMLFTDPDKIDDDVRQYLEPLCEVKPFGDFEPQLRTLGQEKMAVRLDPAMCPAAIAETLASAGATLRHGADLCTAPKARKNATEIRGARRAHERDGVAVCRFLAWLAGASGVSEIDAARQMEQMRIETGELVDLSFDTISATGPNGAMCHYRVSRTSNRTLQEGELFLIDSGGQYRDGTTDITRTVAIGIPSATMVRHFTLVLKGHIALARARFPAGTSGAQLDVLARHALWQAGLDFDHGTGHGVGSFLSVHEGPQRIAKTGQAVLQPGMILSNEPGYYREGAYGIRIENLMLVREAQDVAQGKTPMLGFETLSLAPIDRALIDQDLLDEDETGWLDAYHARVFDRIAPLMPEDSRAWLQAATRPLGT